KKIPFFKNNSYLSKAGNNAASPDIIKEAYNFFRQQIRHIGLNERLRISSFGDREEVVKDTAKVLCMVDTGVNDISVKEVDAELPIKMDDDIPQEIKDMIMDDYKYRYVFSHLSEDGKNINFPISRESEGTQKLFEIIPLIRSAFDSKKVIIIDELDNSLHPHIADLIVKLFNDPDVNTYGSQLIFSTHNMQLMTPEKMRRDQIFFCEKNNGSSTLYSLDDFDKKKVKTSTNYVNWYNEGRFGGVPDINYLKIALFLSPHKIQPSSLSEKEISEISNGFFE
ncbi:ATP-binding protein, partial [Providencia rettgeri]|uniref:ATP/GTP-binding protein n=2 Tax=Morganellaceae TaxID=1903414 RepID=UPI00337A352A